MDMMLEPSCQNSIKQDKHSLRYRQKIVPVDTCILVDLVVRTYATRIDHNATLLVSFRVQEVVAL
jgi:hypothetical protein